MPIIISFFNSMSGIATAVCALVVENPYMAGVGSLVGVAGLILTRIMCTAMNRNLLSVLSGIKPSVHRAAQTPSFKKEIQNAVERIKAQEEPNVAMGPADEQYKNSETARSAHKELQSEKVNEEEKVNGNENENEKEKVVDVDSSHESGKTGPMPGTGEPVTSPALKQAPSGEGTVESPKPDTRTLTIQQRIESACKDIKKAIIVPGYGMALAQAQQQVFELISTLEQKGIEVRIAIHPVAGRMPGHMSVLLAEAGVDYEKLLDMDTVNPEFKEADLVIAIGACDVINPAANTAEGSPIYGMPVLAVEEAATVIICNMDEKPGYSGVDNTLYNQEKTVCVWGNAAETVPALTGYIKEA